MGCVQERPASFELDLKKSAKEQLTFGVSDFVH